MLRGGAAHLFASAPHMLLSMRGDCYQSVSTVEIVGWIGGPLSAKHKCFSYESGKIWMRRLKSDDARRFGKLPSSLSSIHESMPGKPSLILAKVDFRSTNVIVVESRPERAMHGPHLKGLAMWDKIAAEGECECEQSLAVHLPRYVGRVRLNLAEEGGGTMGGEMDDGGFGLALVGAENGNVMEQSSAALVGVPWHSVVQGRRRR